jgi:ADP-ribose pyrophosphatase YjhB (NUDIX family)
VSRPEKQSVAVVIRHPENPEQVLTVLRPADDEDLPNVWGLPAATLRPGEDWEAAVQRVGLEKLGVQLKLGNELEHGTQERRDYRLDMRLYEATITRGTPFVPQPDNAYTQYAKWKWGTAEDLQPAAQRGSLCCRLYLRNAGAKQS